ncbi:electron transfer flavoprotein subunit beta [Streptomyces sp. PRh5]|nr:electron transfer flavoprotein subunit beta [Streptomyces sp. PRh5]
MKIVVCVKYVPDAAGDRQFAEDLTTDRESVDGLLSELDEYAVEQALQIGENADDAEVTVLTVGPEDAEDAVRKALSMGADRGVHVEDEDLHGTDALGTSAVLAKAIEKTSPYGRHRGRGQGRGRQAARRVPRGPEVRLKHRTSRPHITLCERTIRHG